MNDPQERYEYLDQLAEADPLKLRDEAVRLEGAYATLLQRWKEEQQLRLAAEGKQMRRYLHAGPDPVTRAEAEVERLLTLNATVVRRAERAEAEVERLRQTGEGSIFTEMENTIERLLEECEERSVRQSIEHQLADRLAEALQLCHGPMGDVTVAERRRDALAAWEEARNET